MLSHSWRAPDKDGGRQRLLFVADPQVVREAGLVYAPGLLDFGLTSTTLVHALPRRVEDALWLAEAALASRAFSTVLLEVHGNPKKFGLTESRRLSLKARATEGRLIILRQAGEEEASSALLRLSVESAPAAARYLADGSLLGGSIGSPVFRIIPEKSRIPGSPELILEWNSDDRRLRLFEQFPSAGLGSPHPVALFPKASDRSHRPRRWGLSWRLPQGSTAHPERAPLVCAGRSGNTMRVTALDDRAEGFGLRIGQGLAEARAICADLDVVESDPAADRALLDAIADWCDRYTPLVAIDGDDGLMLDISGCAHLFGGEERLIEDVERRMTAFGLAVRIAVGPTPSLGRACSRFDGPRRVTMSEVATALAPLPIAALRLEPQTVMNLARVGLKTVGDLLAAPRAPITRRFGPEPLLRLDQALGREGEAISPRRHLPLLSAERRLAEPIMTEDEILDLAGRLAAGLKTSLEARGKEAGCSNFWSSGSMAGPSGSKSVPRPP